MWDLTEQQYVLHTLCRAYLVILAEEQREDVQDELGRLHLLPRPLQHGAGDELLQRGDVVPASLLLPLLLHGYQQLRQSGQLPPHSQLLQPRPGEGGVTRTPAVLPEVPVEGPEVALQLWPQVAVGVGPRQEGQHGLHLRRDVKYWWVRPCNGRGT